MPALKIYSSYSSWLQFIIPKDSIFKEKKGLSLYSAHGCVRVYVRVCMCVCVCGGGGAVKI